MSRDIRSFTRAELEGLARTSGWETYRARQLYSWMWQKRAVSFSAMTDLGLRLREELSAGFHIYVPETVVRVEDRDGTIRFVFRLEDDMVIESVYIPDGDRRTACVSTQVGCGLGCRICRTARLGLARSLAWHEIAGQVLEIGRAVPERLTNVVFMGMGEPFANYDATMSAVEEVNAPGGINIGARHITVSTAGLPDGIRRYASFRLQSRLAVSLNAADDATRGSLMPVNQRHPLADLLAAVREFTQRRGGKRVTFEYVLLRGINDRPADARNLSSLLQGIPCKVNLIPYNAFEGSDYAAPRPREVERFAELLYPGLPAVTIRRSRGASIGAACGQLAARLERKDA
ncbi:MAG: 23S rRNA (adenine(2503)-C(2))-methyltransferase RlmN [bacterium]